MFKLVEYNKIELLENDSVLAQHTEIEEKFCEVLMTEGKDEFKEKYQEEVEDELLKLDFSV